MDGIQSAGEMHSSPGLRPPNGPYKPRITWFYYWTIVCHPADRSIGLHWLPTRLREAD